MTDTYALGESKAWEKLGYDLWRAPIPGGWLVATFAGSAMVQSQTFIPDPDHEWDGRSLRRTGANERGRLSLIED